MTWRVVARKDVRDAVQSRALWALVAVSVVLSVLSTYAYVEAPALFGEPGGATFAGLLSATAGLAGLFVPLAAIVLCYRSLAGERELGSVRLLLSLPTDRLAVFAGKVAGRAAVLAGGLGAGLAVGLGLGAVLLGAVDPLGALGFLLVTVGFAAVYAAIVVSLSASTASTTRAATLAVGFLAVFELFWDAVAVAVLYVASGFERPATAPDWVVLVAQLSPSSAYRSSLVALLPGLAEAAPAGPWGGGAGAAVEATPAGADAFSVTPEVGLVVLGLWLVVPTVVGYRRFDAADL